MLKIIINTVIISILGVINHFLYNITNNNFIIGLISATNESIYEHTKLTILPLLIFYFILHKDKDSLSKFLITSFISNLLIPILYYSYTGIFGIDNSIINISIFIISIFISLILERHISKYSNPIKNKTAIILLIIYFILTITFTIIPPKIPLFKDSISKTYGILKKS